MKQSQRCPKCGHNRLLYVARVADQMQRGANPYVGAVLACTGSGFATGELEAAACRRCGYVELYLKDPSTIPIDGENVREIVGPGT